MRKMMLISALLTMSCVSARAQCGDVASGWYQCPGKNGAFCFISYHQCTYGFTNQCVALQILYCSCNPGIGVMDYYPNEPCGAAPSASASRRSAYVRYSRVFVRDLDGAWLSLDVATGSPGRTGGSAGCSAAAATRQVPSRGAAARSAASLGGDRR